MIQGYVGIPLWMTVNFQPSRAGLTTVGYTLMNTDGAVAVPRTQLEVGEIPVNGRFVGIFRARITFEAPFQGVVLCDTGQDPNAVNSAERFRAASDEVCVIEHPVVESQLVPLKDLVGSLADENTMKVPNGAVPSEMRYVRKRPGDADWTDPLSDKTVHIVRKPGQERYGGPPPA